MRRELSDIPAVLRIGIETAIVSAVVQLGMPAEVAVAEVARGVRMMAITQGYSQMASALLEDVAAHVGNVFIDC